MFISVVLNNFIVNLFIIKYNDHMSDFVKGHASSLYKSAGIHLLLISCITTSSEAILPNLPKILFAAR